MKGDNGVPETPDWQLPERCTPLNCKVCSASYEVAERADEHIVRGEN